MKIKRLSLRARIFVAMILLVLLASVLIAVVTIYQYNEEAKDYHKERLERKERAIRRSIEFALRETTYPVTSENIPLIFKDVIFDIDAVHSQKIMIYDLEGQLLKSSKRAIYRDTTEICLDAEILNQLSNTLDHRYVVKNEENGQIFQSSYTYITDRKFKNLAILNLPYLEDDDFLNKELDEFMGRLSFAYLAMILAAIVFAYFISKYITKSLKTISDKMNEIRLEKRNKKIVIESSSDEIETLVKSYNSMIDELEDSAVKLATSEREQAWREMAKQVAHEIKNPLTPMRLSVQSFQRKFNPEDENIHQKVEEYSNTLIQQIDTMSSIASAFSNFAKMPAQKKEVLNVVLIVKLALDIFNEHYITFYPEEEEIIAKFDRTQLIRVVTNLVKNGIQAIPEGTEHPKIEVRVFSKENKVYITIEDNGSGIPEENKAKVFEPKFTTKTSGMGLGLAMVKNIVETYNGNINFVSQQGKGTTFTVIFPKE
ncbi:GHKL domain-containing protein [Winogradskyella echinorum]|uniref:histidine kinase n=1 Tax=Winogradskyella echinorum TaxID=538189 RepID=A0ABR6XYV2_9FLAO|nr:HAMP domain-containing sensor histidine kinase [Winogradskyella echinorum]MBC3845655.1 GHKL domain-containing protein [Winogradskyella echinorum]MBC5750003.1 GHKL domain-containing protein [Winogradskyella echinorum]